MIAPHPDAARIAADVAVRYGAIVRPDVVRAVPAGASGLPLPVWNGRDLIYPESTPNYWRQGVSQHFIRKARMPKPHVQLRRDRVQALHGTGLIDTEIADALGVSIQVVYGDRVALGLDNNRLVREAQGNPKHAMIGAMARDGARLEVIAAAVGLTAGTVQDIAKDKFGIALRRTTAVEARHARLRQMIADGVPYETMITAFTVGYSVVVADLRKLGVEPPPPVVRIGKHRLHDERVAARRLRIGAMIASGASQADIQVALGISAEVYRSALVHLRRVQSAQQVAA